MLTLYFDGSSKGNPGPSAAGFVVFEDGKELYRKVSTVSIGTNNQAEYFGLIMGLTWLTETGAPNKVTIRGDSQLVINQMIGTYRVKNDLLKVLHRAAVGLAMGREITFEWVPREENSLIDSLCQDAADRLKSGL